MEQPFRSGPRRPARRTRCAEAGVAAAIRAVVGGTAALTGGLPGRFSPEATSIAAFIDYEGKGQGYFRMGSCFLDSGLASGRFNSEGCLSEDPTRANDLLLGD